MYINILVDYISNNIREGGNIIYFCLAGKFPIHTIIIYISENILSNLIKKGYS